MKASPLQDALNAGEFSPLTQARVRFDKYKNGLATCVNMIPLVQGGATRRTGSYFISAVKDSAKATRLIPFEFSTTQAYIIELGDRYFRFYKDRGAIVAPTPDAYVPSATVTTTISPTSAITVSVAAPAVVTWNTHGLSDGDPIVFSTTGALPTGLLPNVVYYVVNKAANTFQVASAVGGTAITTTGTQSGTHSCYHPCKVTLAAHGIDDNLPVYFTTDGGLPTGITASATYYVTMGAAGYFFLSTYPGGLPIKTTGSQSGVHTGFRKYAAGDNVTYSSDVYHCITAPTTGQTPTDATYWYEMAASYEIPHPYLEADLPNVKYAQSADVLYITHPSYAPRKLSRTGHTAWKLEAIDFIDGPYIAINTSSTTITLSATTIDTEVTVTASSNIFASTDIGRSIRFKSGGTTWGWLKITAFSSASVVSAMVRRAPNAATASKDWRLGTWSGTTGYPSCVMFFEDRLFFAGSSSYPQRIDGSKSGDYETFSPTGDTGTVTDDSGVAVTLNASDVNAIRWMQDDEKGLLIGTVGGEWLVRPSSLSEALTPTNVTAKRSTSFGTANIQAKKTGKACIYIQRAGRKVRELAYVYEVDGFRAPDMTVLSEHITKGGLVEFDYQQEPFSIIWFVRADGVLVGMTYERDQDVVGWHRHILGGVFGSSNAVVESVAVIPTPDTTADEVWLIVKRTIDGNTKRYIEYITPRFDDEDTEDAFFVDCGLTYNGAPADVISGLDHLEGETVQVLADGAVHPDRTISSGSITLNAEYSKVHIGLGYNSDIKTLRLEAGAADGTAQGKTKRITRVDVRLYKSLGMQYGKDDSHLDTVVFRTSADDLNSPPVLFTGDKSFIWNSGYDIEGQMFFRQAQPLPLTILYIAPQVVTQDR